MSRHEDDAWSQPTEVEDRDLSDDEEPVATCSVCDEAISLDPTCDNSNGPLYCEPCHDEVYP